MKSSSTVYRILARIEGQKIRLFTRNGNDWSHKLPHIVKEIAAMGFQNAWLDGEVVVPNDVGVPDFQALQNAFDSSRTQSIIYYVFDVPFYAGFDLRAVPLTERREFLKGLFETRASKTVVLMDAEAVGCDATVSCEIDEQSQDQENQCLPRPLC